MHRNPTSYPWGFLGLLLALATVMVPALGGEEFVTREYSVYSSEESDPQKPYQEFVTREYSVFSSDESDPEKPYKEFITREYSVYLANPDLPRRVTGLTAATSTTVYGAISLDWSSHLPLADGDTVRYRIYAETSSFSSISLLTPVAFVPRGQYTATVPSLQGDEDYFLAVVAEDSFGNFDPNVTAVPARSSVGSLGEVGSLTATTGQTSLDFSWQPPGGAANFLAAYRLSFDGQAPIQLGPAETDWTVAGLAAATGYSFQISTLDVFGTLSPGITLVAPTLLPNPGNPRFDMVGGQLVMEWDPVEPDALLLSYAIYQQSNPFTSLAGLTERETAGTTSVVLGTHASLVGEDFAVASVSLLDQSAAGVQSIEVPALSPPSILSHSATAVEVPVGGTTTLSVVAGGFPPPDFQWYAGVSGDIITPIDGETNGSLTLAPVAADGNYWVRATNTQGYVDSPTFSVTAIDLGFAVEEPIGQPMLNGEGRAFADGAAGVSSETRTFTLHNTSAGTVTFANLALDGASDPGFALDATGFLASLAPGEITSFAVSFTPATEGAQAGMLAFDFTGIVDGTFEIPFTGNARAVDTSDANLVSLVVSDGVLVPAFNPLLRDFSVDLPNSVTSLALTPTASEPLAAIEINGVPVESGQASDPLPLAPGENQVSVIVTSADGGVVKTYSVTVTRLPQTEVTTGLAENVDDDPVIVNGVVTPYGSVEVFFEYGPDTAYGQQTATRYLSGTTAQEVTGVIGGLAEAQTFHYRLVAVLNGLRFEGDDLSFIKSPLPAVAYTGDAQEVSSSGATLLGIVDPGSFPVQVFFEYGLTDLYGSETARQGIPADSGLVDVSASAGGLLGGAVYHYRIVVQSPLGEVRGEDSTFRVGESPGSATAPTAVPTVVTGSATGIGTTAATLLGQVNAKGGTTLVQFEYGETASYGRRTIAQGVGNSETEAAIALRAEGLIPGQVYHYRLIATNSMGTTVGEGSLFQTDFEPPVATTGTAIGLSTTSVLIHGTVRARGSECAVVVDYGTDPQTLSQSVATAPASVDGHAEIPVSAELANLSQGIPYFYRVRAMSSQAGTGLGAVLSFNVDSLSGLSQNFPPAVPPGERDGSVRVDLTYDGVSSGNGGGWRFRGEHTWRFSGSVEAATGLVAGTRIIEFRPNPGFVQPPSEALAIFTGADPAVPIVLTRNYTSAGPLPPTGSLAVTLKPDSIFGDSGWRFSGEDDLAWRDSGVEESGLVPGNYVIEAKPVSLFATPLPVNVRVFAGSSSTVTMTYTVAETVVGAEPQVLGFEEISSQEVFPYPFAGQLRSDAGKASGFVVRPSVVATAGHVVFDDGTLSAVTGMQWLHQQHRGVHEPAPQVPRGFYLMTGYADQRVEEIGDGTSVPGQSTPESQNLDVATLYFQGEAGRGGHSGFLASDLPENEHLLSNAQKVLVGYPIEGADAAQRDRMHATPTANVTFASAFGRTYTSSEIRGSGGVSGGPVCVLDKSGSFFPAAIYLGGTGQTVVRSIDSAVVQLIGFAEASSEDEGGGAGTFAVEDSPVANAGMGSLRVLIEPEEARLIGAGWRINALGDYLEHGTTDASVTPGGPYSIQFSPVPGFELPVTVPVTIAADTLTTVTFTYEELVLAPVIDSGTLVEMEVGALVDPENPGSALAELDYQITAQNAPDTFSFIGALPSGVTFDAVTGSFSGVPVEAGRFEITVAATNTGGADSQRVTFLVRPTVSDQLATFARNEAGSYQVLSSDAGEGLSYAATGLPEGLGLSAATGVISGTPVIAGEFAPLVTVTRRGAVSKPTPLRIDVTAFDEPPVFVLEPEPVKSVEYGFGTTLVALAEGAPVIRYQWFQGAICDTNNPIFGATSPTFVSPPLTEDTTFWVRAYSISGEAQSKVSTITVTPSRNPSLTGLELSEGTLVPAFNPNRLAYTVEVSNPVSELAVIPISAVDRTVVRVDGSIVEAGQASVPVPLAVGETIIQVSATAENGSERVYTITATRNPAPVPTTGTVSAISDIAATLEGTINMINGATVFFEYGTTTDYGANTPQQFVPGTGVFPVQATITGLSGGTQYHYRLNAVNGGELIHGADQVFTTVPARPLVSTGTPVGITAEDATHVGATFIGAVNRLGLDATAYFRYRLVGSGPWIDTPVQTIADTSVIVDVTQAVSGLDLDGIYEVQLVAERAGGPGPSEGPLVEFVATPSGGGGDGQPDAVPSVTTGVASEIGPDSATVDGVVNPNDGATLAHIEYGLTEQYGFATAAQSIGSGSAAVNVAIPLDGLEPGRTYHFRVVAANSLGTTAGGDASFTTSFAPPIVTTGDPVALSPVRARLVGTVDPRGATVPAAFEYGTDGLNFPNSQAISTDTVGGTGPSVVEAVIDGLVGGQIYYYRLRAGNPGSETTGETRRMNLGALLGIDQRPPRPVPAGDRQGEVTVSLLPAGIGNWRFSGERSWRDSGSPATGLTSGQRTIEYRPVSGYITPPEEELSVLSNGATIAVSALYYPSAQPGTAGLTVSLGPPSVADMANPVAERGQFRVLGDSDTTWRNSGDEIMGLEPGRHLIECKPVAGWSTPVAHAVTLANGETASLSINYPADIFASPNPAVPLSFAETEDPELPYAFVGRIESDAGSFSGVVVKPRVVATAAQAVFDEETLSFVSKLDWRHQRENEVHEPNPQVPRGYYVLDGYDTMRTAEANPGVLSLASQNLNLAVLYFYEDAGRGGYSGFLASDEEDNEFVTSGNLKTLIGYPHNPVPSQNRGRMHATPLAGDPLTWREGRVYGTAAVSSGPGFIGGPLCVQHEDGLYYPAAILVGTGLESSFRTFDDTAVDLFGRAATSANGGDNNTGGGITHSSFTSVGSSSGIGAVKVTILPSGALAMGAGWRLSPETSYRQSEFQLNNLTPGSYHLELRAVEGFPTPALVRVDVVGGKLSDITFDYSTLITEPSFLTAPGNQSLGVGSSTAPLAFTVDDPDTDASSLTVTAASSEPGLLPLSGILLGGSGGNRTVTITPVADRLGSGTVTLTVSDGALSASRAFIVTVTGTALETWRFANFGTTLGMGDAADDADPDGDGQDNASELTAGTDPNNSSDVFRTLSVSRSAEGFSVVVPGKPGRDYTLQRGPTPSGPWTGLVTSGVLADDREVTLQDAAPPPGRAFYRVSVAVP